MQLRRVVQITTSMVEGVQTLHALTREGHIYQYYDKTWHRLPMDVYVGEEAVDGKIPQDNE